MFFRQANSLKLRLTYLLFVYYLLIALLYLILINCFNGQTNKKLFESENAKLELDEVEITPISAYDNSIEEVSMKALRFGVYLFSFPCSGTEEGRRGRSPLAVT